MVLRRFLKKIQDEENSFRVPRTFQTEERSKAGSNRKNPHTKASSCASRLQAIHHCTCDSVFRCPMSLLLPWDALLRFSVGNNCPLVVFQAGAVEKV